MSGRMGMLWVAVVLSTVIAPRPVTAQDRLVVRTEPGTPVIATEILISAGLADEPEGREGVAHLAARAVTRPIQAALDSLDAHLEVRSHKDAVTFTLTAAPDAWPEASRLLLLALFRDPVSPPAVAAERDSIAGELAARRDNPADAAMRAADAAFYGTDNPWGRPAVTDPAAIRTLSHSDVDEFLRSHFRPERAFAAVAGPVGASDVDRQLGSYFGASAADTAGPRQLRPTRKPEASPVRRDYNSVTTWVSVSFPFEVDTDVEALRMLAYVVGEDLAFGPTRQAVYDSRAEVLPRLGGGELRLTVVVPPEEADAWAERVGEAVNRSVREGDLEERWYTLLRRYRGERLHGLASPEDRAAELARNLFTTGRSGDPVPDFTALSPARLRSVGAELGEPVVTLLGPILDDQD